MATKTGRFTVMKTEKSRNNLVLKDFKTLRSLERLQPPKFYSNVNNRNSKIMRMMGYEGLKKELTRRTKMAEKARKEGNSKKVKHYTKLYNNLMGEFQNQINSNRKKALKTLRKNKSRKARKYPTVKIKNIKSI